MITNGPRLILTLNVYLFGFLIFYVGYTFLRCYPRQPTGNHYKYACYVTNVYL